MTRPTDVMLSPIKLPETESTPQSDPSAQTIKIRGPIDEREFLAGAGTRTAVTENDPEYPEVDDVVVIAQKIVSAGLRNPPSKTARSATPTTSPRTVVERPAVIQPSSEHAAHVAAEETVSTPSADVGAITLQPPRQIVQSKPVVQTKPVEPPATEARSDRPASARVRPQRRGNRNEARDFVIRYEGTFVGSYRSHGRVTNRTAFKNIAQAIAQRLGKNFDPEQLDIFKPIPLAFEKPTALEQAKSGTFEWFGQQESK